MVKAAPPAAAAAAAKKQKVIKKPTTTTKKKIIKKKKTLPDKSTTQNPSSSSNPPPPPPSSDSDPDDTTPDQIHKLIEPYTKDQLIQFIINAALTNPTLYTRIRDTADTDISHRKIFVFGLGWDTTKETLAQSFKPFGEIEDCNVVIDRVTGKAKGFGFVQFKTRKEAMKALKEPRKKINNRMASCQLAALGPPASAAPAGGDNSWRKIYVSNVHPGTDPERLRLFFEKFGDIETGPIGFDSVTGKSRGFALFVYRTQDGFRKALEEPYKVFEGHQLHCQRASSEGKNKSVAVSGSGTGNSVNTGNGLGVQQPTAPQMMAAAQNFALFNPMYGGLFAANPFLASGVLGQMGVGGAGGYFAGAAGGLNVGAGNASLLGGVPPVIPGPGLQNAYPKNRTGPASPSGLGSGSRAQGAGGSFGGYPPHM